MASLKEMRNRIASVKATQKITKAMQMVAAAKLRRAQEAAQNARPYAQRMAAVIANLASGVSGDGAPKLLAGTGRDQVHLVVVAAADRGLAGGFTTSIIRAAREHINALLAQGYTVDIVAPGSDLGAHKLVVVPSLYTVSDADAAAISDFVAAGGHALVTFFSGIVDENDRVRTGGYPGAFRDLLGVSTEEFFPLAAGETVALSNGSTATSWTEWVHLAGATAVATFADGPLSGVPAVTRNGFGEGTAWYVATELDATSLRDLVAAAARDAGVAAPLSAPDDVEIVRRRGASDDYLFVINHSDAAFDVTTSGTELITDTAIDTTLAVPAGEVRVVRESRVNS